LPCSRHFLPIFIEEGTEKTFMLSFERAGIMSGSSAFPSSSKKLSMIRSSSFLVLDLEHRHEVDEDKTSTGIGFLTAISPVASKPWAISTFSPMSSAPFTASFPAIWTPSPM